MVKNKQKDQMRNIYPIDFKMDRDGKGANPREHRELCHRELCDWGE